MFGEPNFIGQYTVPLECIRTGYRSVPLKNNFGEVLELSGRYYDKNSMNYSLTLSTSVSALLVHVTWTSTNDSLRDLLDVQDPPHVEATDQNLEKKENGKETDDVRLLANR